MEKQTAVRETLLKEFANCSDKLFTLGIIRTDSFTGEIGEFIASKYFKLSLAGKSTKAYDGVCPKGYKYQIKSKVISNNNLTHHISNLKYQDFDYLVVVYFDIYYNPISILKIPSNKINTEEYIIGASSVHSFSQNIARLKLLQKEQVAIRNFAQSYLNLQKEGIIRSRKVVGDIGEYYACKRLNLKLSSNKNEKGLDAIGQGGLTFEIKTRRVYDSERRTSETRRINNLIGKNADYLIVAVQDGNYIKKFKPDAKVLYTTEERVEMLEALRIVDKVVVYESVDSKFLGTIDFDILALGEDHRGGRFDAVEQWCEEHNKRVVRLKRTKGICSSDIKKSLEAK